MPVSIVSNLAASISQRNIAKNADGVDRALTRVSSGTRVFSASEDAASLAIGTALRVDISAYRAAQANTAQGVSMLEIADGSLGKLSEIVTRMKVLANNCQSDQISDTERGFLDLEYQDLLAEADRITASTIFNGTALLGGATQIQLNTQGTNVDADDGYVGFDFTSAANPGDVFQIEYYAATQVMTVTNQTQSISQTLFVATPQVGQLVEYTFSQLGFTLTLNSDFDDTTDLVYSGATEEFDVVASATAAPAILEFQVGTGTDPSDRVSLTMPVTDSAAMGVAGTNVANSANATVAVGALDSALDVINAARGVIGANMSRLQFAAGNVAIIQQNSETARSVLLDADIAEEVTNMAAKQVLLQAGLDMLARANERPEMLLQLLR